VTIFANQTSKGNKSQQNRNNMKALAQASCRQSIAAALLLVPRENWHDQPPGEN